jgi:xylan 1,4-beta-xylosidase
MVLAILRIILIMGLCLLPAATPYQITVDAGKSTSVLNRFWENCIGSDHFYTVLHSGYGGNNQSAYKLAKTELGMKSVRAHGILNDDVGIYKEDGSGNPVYAWTNYDSIVDFIVSLGWKPIIELSFMPSALASGNTTTCWYNGVPANVTPPKDYVKWKNLIYEIIKHSKERYGAGEIEQWHWEVWNEPDIKPQFFTGTEDDYFRIYDYAAEGAVMADSNVKFGGPATALSDTAGLLKRFVNHCMTMNYGNPAKKSTKVDFISWHQYPWNEGDQNATAFAPRNRGISLFLKRYPTLKLGNLQTEWNASARYNYFDDEANASFVVKSIHSLFSDMNQGAEPPDVFSFWTVSDIFEENNLTSTSAYAGAMGLILRQRDAKKPAYNAFKMLHMLGDSSLALTGGTKNTTGLNGLATISKDKSKVQILIYDHNYGSGNNPTFSTTMDTVHLQIKNLPFAAGKIKVERYGVDKNHSNSFTTWVNQGRPAKPTSLQWDQLVVDGTLKLMDSSYTVAMTSNSFSKDLIQPQPGVSLLILTGEVPVGIKTLKNPAPHSGLRIEGSVRAKALSLTYSHPEKISVTVSLVDAHGKVYSSVASQSEQAPGEYQVRFTDLALGTYFGILHSEKAVVKTTALTILE